MIRFGKIQHTNSKGPSTSETGNKTYTLSVSSPQ